jgi:hypothetical protein
MGIVLIFVIIVTIAASDYKSALTYWRVRLLFLTFIGMAIAVLILSVSILSLLMIYFYSYPGD